MTRYIFFLVLILFHLPSTNANELNNDDQIRYQSLIEEVRCLVCQNQSVAESNAELAKDLRREIKIQIQGGKSDDEIKDYLLDRYGEFVLLNPPIKNETLVLWVGPLIIIFIGTILILIFFRNKIKPKISIVEDNPLSSKEEEQVQKILKDLKQ